jgi:hypothetical protein
MADSGDWEEIKGKPGMGAASGGTPEALRVSLVEAGQALGDQALAGEISGAVILVLRADGEVSISLMGMHLVTGMGLCQTAQGLLMRRVLS